MHYDPEYLTCKTIHACNLVVVKQRRGYKPPVMDPCSAYRGNGHTQSFAAAISHHLQFAVCPILVLILLFSWLDRLL